MLTLLGRAPDSADCTRHPDGRRVVIPDDIEAEESGGVD